MTEKSITKSDIRKLLCVSFPETFERGTTDVQIRFQDAIQIIKSVSEAGSVCQSVEDLLRAIRGEANHTMREKASVRVVTLAFDKYKFVPLGKGVEQEKRNAKARASDLSASQVPSVESFRTKRPYLEVDHSLPFDWSAAIGDRDVGTPLIINNLISILIRSPNEYNGRYNFDLRVGKRVGIDGHYLTLHDVLSAATVYPSRKLALASCGEVTDARTYLSNLQLWKAHQLDSDDLIFETPIVFELVIDAYGETQYLMYFESRLRNRIGEADFSMFTLHRLWSRILYDDAFLDVPNHASAEIDKASAFPMLDAEFLGVDTDVICLGLLYAARIDRRMLMAVPTMFVRYEPRLSWAFSKEFNRVNPKFEKWVNITALYERLKSGVFEVPKMPAWVDTTHAGDDVNVTAGAKASLSDMIARLLKHVAARQHEDISKKFRNAVHEPVWSVVLALLVGGCDYTAGFYGITHESSFSALKRHADFINNLAVYAPPAGGVAESWSDVVVPSAKSGGLGLYYVDGVSYGHLVQSAYMSGRPDLCDLHPNRLSWSAVCDKTKHLAARNTAPPAAQIQRHLMHLMYYVMLLSQLGDCVLLEPSDLGAYKFRKLDTAKPWSRTNIARCVAGEPVIGGNGIETPVVVATPQEMDEADALLV